MFTFDVEIFQLKIIFEKGKLSKEKLNSYFLDGNQLFNLMIRFLRIDYY